MCAAAVAARRQPRLQLLRTPSLLPYPSPYYTTRSLLSPHCTTRSLLSPYCTTRSLLSCSPARQQLPCSAGRAQEQLLAPDAAAAPPAAGAPPAAALHASTSAAALARRAPGHARRQGGDQCQCQCCHSVHGHSPSHSHSHSPTSHGAC
jgi:hypothetical protein